VSMQGLVAGLALGVVLWAYRAGLRDRWHR